MNQRAQTIEVLGPGRRPITYVREELGMSLLGGHVGVSEQLDN